jgi:hypothetical protein
MTSINKLTPKLRKAPQPPLSHAGAVADADRAKRPPLDQPNTPPDWELNPGDRVEGLASFGKPTGEFGTVEQTNVPGGIQPADMIAGNGQCRGFMVTSCVRFNGRPPSGKKFSLPFFQLEVPRRRRLWNPEIDLKLSLTALAKCSAPCPDFIRGHHQSSASPKSARVSNFNRQRWRARSRHGSQEDRQANPKTTSEGFGPRTDR